MKPRADDDFGINSGVQPPSSVSVDERSERKPLLWLPNGTGLYQRIGFRTTPDAKREKIR